MKTIDDALNLRRRIFAAFELAESAPSEAECERWLTFAVVGGGPTGCEVAGQIAELARRTLHEDFRSIDATGASVLLFDAGQEVLATFGGGLSRKAAAGLEHLGVEIRTQTLVTSIDGGGMDVESPRGTERIATHTVVWAAAVRPHRSRASWPRRRDDDLGRSLPRGRCVRRRRTDPAPRRGLQPCFGPRAPTAGSLPPASSRPPRGRGRRGSAARTCTGRPARGGRLPSGAAAWRPFGSQRQAIRVGCRGVHVPASAAACAGQSTWRVRARQHRPRPRPHVRRPRTERGPTAPPLKRPKPPEPRTEVPAAITATTRITISTADIRTSAHTLRVGLAADGRRRARRAIGVSWPTLRRARW